MRSFFRQRSLFDTSLNPWPSLLYLVYVVYCGYMLSCQAALEGTETTCVFSMAPILHQMDVLTSFHISLFT